MIALNGVEYFDVMFIVALELVCLFVCLFYPGLGLNNKLISSSHIDLHFK